jgi:hypothetical protein
MYFCIYTFIPCEYTITMLHNQLFLISDFLDRVSYHQRTRFIQMKSDNSVNHWWREGRIVNQVRCLVVLLDWIGIKSDLESDITYYKWTWPDCRRWCVVKFLSCGSLLFPCIPILLYIHRVHFFWCTAKKLFVESLHIFKRHIWGNISIRVSQSVQCTFNYSLKGGAWIF